MLKACIIGLLLTAWAPQFVVSEKSGDTPPPTDAIVYHFENEKFLVPRIDLKLDEAGQGTLVFERKGLQKPVERVFAAGDEAMDNVLTALGRLDFLNSTEPYQSKDEHPNLGTTVVEVARDGSKRAVQFNYTTNRDMDLVATTLRGIATREIYAFDLETAARHQPLETPALIAALSREIDLGRIADPAMIVPVLRSLESDPSLPLITRNRASDLAARIEKAKGKKKK